ncbi:hypothetical protein FOL47_008644 [Perkinsus chesapeaki]|uniref:Uncharacterized protein n=1 Tax=Perkinsus chesapeaki TaxID=330153 RepID=A0A7J6LCU7_PERCH|nr:hypothetical protein FOL47_008644 [Perkinsus chesapeaki]
MGCVASHNTDDMIGHTSIMLPREDRVEGTQVRTAAEGSGEIELLTEDQLIHKGIACAQAASVTKDETKRVKQLKEAKRFLMAALDRQQKSDNVSRLQPSSADAVSFHLAAVLLSLGEDPVEVRKRLSIPPLSTPTNNNDKESGMLMSPGFCPTPATTAESSPGPESDVYGEQGGEVSVQLLGDTEMSPEQRTISRTQNSCIIEAVGSKVSYRPAVMPEKSPPLPSCAPDVLVKYHSFMQAVPSPAAFSPVPSQQGSEVGSLQIRVDRRHRSLSRQHSGMVAAGCGGYDDDCCIDSECGDNSVIDFDPDNDEPLSDEKCDELLSEIVSEAGSSLGHSPGTTPSSEWNISDFNPLLKGNRSRSLTVFMHSGITGEMISKFEISLVDKSSIDQLYAALEASLQRECGLGISETHWSGNCELRMCTVPKTPPAEMDIYTSRAAPEGSIRLKSLTPHTLCPGRIGMLNTNPLRRGLDYSVVLVSQMDSGNSCWLSGKSLLIDHKLGVIQFALSDMQIKSLLRRTQDGLFDVYLVVDGSLRSENRRTVVVVDNSGVTPNAQTGDGDVSDGDSSDSCDTSDVASWAEFDPIL